MFYIKILGNWYLVICGSAQIIILNRARIRVAGCHWKNRFIGNVQIDPNKVDVNVSPTKSEVKFHQDGAVFDAVRSAVKSSLLEHGMGPDAESVARANEALMQSGGNMQAAAVQLAMMAHSELQENVCHLHINSPEYIPGQPGRRGFISGSRQTHCCC